MGAENVLQGGVEVAIPGDRKRTFKLGVMASAWLAKKHGTIKKVYAKLAGTIGPNGEKLEPREDAEGFDLTDCQLEALVDIAYAGFLRDAQANKEEFTLESAVQLLDDFGFVNFLDIINGNSKETLPGDGEEDPTTGQTKTT